MPEPCAAHETVPESKADGIFCADFAGHVSNSGCNLWGGCCDSSTLSSGVSYSGLLNLVWDRVLFFLVAIQGFYPAGQLIIGLLQ